MESFMQHHLVLWVQKLEVSSSSSIDYTELCDGVLLNDVMRQIDPTPQYDTVIRAAEDSQARQHNWEILLKNIRAFYREVLQQMLLVRMPNIKAIIKDPDKELTTKEVERALLLILGCAVHSENKEYFIDRIKLLDINHQHAIVASIKQITKEGISVVPLMSLDTVDTEHLDKLYDALLQLTTERDSIAQEANDLLQDRDYYQQLRVNTSCDSPATPNCSSLSVEKQQHVTVELAETKAKLRHVRQELEEKIELMTDVQEELEDQKQSTKKLKYENLELVQEARAARTYRDELDMLKEKVSKVDRYEAQISRYKEQMNELEFVKIRLEELREENTILSEGKRLVEEELENYKKRLDMVSELEVSVMSYRKQVETLSQQSELERSKIEVLTEEIAQLEFDKKNSMNVSATLEHELEEAKKRVNGLGRSLSTQLEESSNAKVLRLELDNLRLQRKLKDFEETTLIEKTAVNLELQRENERLAEKVSNLQESSSESLRQLMDSEAKQREMNLTEQKVSKDIEAIKEMSQRQISELEKENTHLTQTLKTLRERSKKSQDLRVKDIEKENVRLHDSVTSLGQEVSRVTFENRQLTRAYNDLEYSYNKVPDLESENAGLENENRELHKQLVKLKLVAEKCDKLEKENIHLDTELRKLNRARDLLNSATQKKDELEKLNIDVTVANERLKREAEMEKTASSNIINDLENEKERLSNLVEEYRKSENNSKYKTAKFEQMETEFGKMSEENLKFVKTLDLTNNYVKQLELDKRDLEAEIITLQKSLDSLKQSLKHLEALEKDMADVEVELSNTNREKANLEKENRILKTSLESKDIVIDNTSHKLHSIDRENKNLQKVVERSNSMNRRLKELEKENKELVQQIGVEKKTVTTLHDDLFNEKLRTQQLSNELEKLGHELERVGTSKERLVLLQSSQQDSRYKVFETMMEEEFKTSLRIKDDKISALESRLTESKNRNQKLEEDLRSTRHECEMLKQRREEEQAATSKDHHKSSTHLYIRPPASPVSTTKDILHFKDHLVEVERTNATLLAENKSYVAQCEQHNERIKLLESQNMTLQTNLNSAQSGNARLEVTNTTLQSQCTAVATQIETLQGQLNHVEAEHEILLGNHDELQTVHHSLSTDHNALQQLHDQLSNEYETLISEHGSLKSVHRALTGEVKDLRKQLAIFFDGKDDLNKVIMVLEKEREQLKSETKSFGQLQADYTQLAERNGKLTKDHENLLTDYKLLLTDHKNIKTEYNKLLARNEEIKNNLDDNRTNLHGTEIEIAKLVKRCEAVDEMNVKVEEDNRQLIYQVQTLLSQNHELLTQALNSKDHFAEEEKAYLEKLADLRRQKEKLEEKIMEQYKLGRWDNSPRKKGSFGATLVKKARGLLNKARSRSRPNLSTEREEFESVHENGMRTLPRKFEFEETRRSSDADVLEQNRIAMLKTRAKSTTALDNQRLDDDEDYGRPNCMGDAELRASSVPRRSGTISPLDEIVSLKQFLSESNNSPSSRRKILQCEQNLEDSESQDSSVPNTPRVLQRQQPNNSQRPQSCVQLSNSKAVNTDIPPKQKPVLSSVLSGPPYYPSAEYMKNQSNNNSNNDRNSALDLIRNSGASRRDVNTSNTDHKRFHSPTGRDTCIPEMWPAPPSGRLSQPHRIHNLKVDSSQRRLRPQSALPCSNRTNVAGDQSKAAIEKFRSKSPGLLSSVNEGKNHREKTEDPDPLTTAENQPYIPKPVPLYPNTHDRTSHQHPPRHENYLSNEHETTVQSSAAFTPRPKSQVPEFRNVSTPISSSTPHAILNDYCSPILLNTGNPSSVPPISMPTFDSFNKSSYSSSSRSFMSDSPHDSKGRASQLSVGPSLNDSTEANDFTSERFIPQHTWCHQPLKASTINPQSEKSSIALANYGQSNLVPKQNIENRIPQPHSRIIGKVETVGVNVQTICPSKRPSGTLMQSGCDRRSGDNAMSQSLYSPHGPHSYQTKQPAGIRRPQSAIQQSYNSNQPVRQPHKDSKTQETVPSLSTRGMTSSLSFHDSPFYDTPPRPSTTPTARVLPQTKPTKAPVNSPVDSTKGQHLSPKQNSVWRNKSNYK